MGEDKLNGDLKQPTLSKVCTGLSWCRGGVDSVATNSYFEQLNSEKNSSNPESSTEDSSSQTAAKTELKRLLNTYLSGNENFYDISSEDKDKITEELNEVIKTTLNYDEEKDDYATMY